MPELKFHIPTGAVPPPFVLVEGEEKAGKSTEIAKFTGNARIGQTYWIELGSGERTGEWYIRNAGAKYILADHDAVATWRGLNEQVDAIAEDVEKRLTAGEKTPMIVIDSMSAEWKGLSKWADWKARNSKNAKKILEKDPNADITIGPAYWNPATARHEDLLSKLAAIPAIIIFTAKGKEVTEFGKDGNPVAGGRKTWSVAAQKDLGFFVDCWVRMYRGGPAEIVSCRGITDAIVPGVDDGVTVKAVDLEHLIFGRYGFDPDNTMRRPDRELDATGLSVDEELRQSDQEDPNGGSSEERVLVAAEALEAAKEATTRDKLTQLWKDAVRCGLMGVRFSGNTLEGHLTAEAKRITDSEAQTPAAAVETAAPVAEPNTTAAAVDADEEIRIGVAKLLDDATNATTRDEITAFWHEAVEANWMDIQIAGDTLRAHLIEHVRRVKVLDPEPSGEKAHAA